MWGLDGPRLSIGGWATLVGDETDWVWWEEQESGGGGCVGCADDVAGVREPAWADRREPDGGAVHDVSGAGDL
jgi:hypothetical protein